MLVSREHVLVFWWTQCILLYVFKISVAPKLKGVEDLIGALLSKTLQAMDNAGSKRF